MNHPVVWVIAVALLLAAWRFSRRGRSGTAEPNPARRRRRALLVIVALVGGQALIGIPAYADFCNTDPPNPDRPASGMVGAIDPAPIGTGSPGSVYQQFGYAGQVWYTYDLGCGGGAVNPNAAVGTWAGNQLLNVGKNLVGATNGLHYALLRDDLLKPLDDLITTGTAALYNSIYAPWFGLAALVLGVMLFRSVFRGDLATISKRGMWALAGMWLAAATYLTPLIYTHVLDDLLITGTSQAQAGFLKEVGVDQRDALPTILEDQVVYRNWLRGEFGSPDVPEAQKYGRPLLSAQSWDKLEAQQGQDTGSSQPKKDQFTAVAAQLKPTSVYGYFQGIDGSRVGAGFLATVQGIAFALFQLLAKATILLAQILLRVLVLAGPIIGLVAMIFHDVLRKVGRAVAAAVLHVVVISVLAGMHTLVLTWIFNPKQGFTLLTQMLLASLITLAFFLIGKPGRRMFQMIELAVGAAGTAMPGAPPGLFSRFRRGAGGPTPQDEFWDQVRTTDPDGEAVPRAERRRIRPEAIDAVAAVAPSTRPAELPPGSVAGGVAGGPPELPGRPMWDSSVVSAGSTVPGGRAAASAEHGRALVAGPSAPRSRVVDTAPVVDRSWDRPGPESYVVPSAIGDGPRPPERQPRRAEMEVVAGRPVWVVYRPSRGLEVRDSGTTPVS